MGLPLLWLLLLILLGEESFSCGAAQGPQNGFLSEQVGQPSLEGGGILLNPVAGHSAQLNLQSGGKDCGTNVLHMAERQS